MIAHVSVIVYVVCLIELTELYVGMAIAVVMLVIIITVIVVMYLKKKKK